MIKKKKQDLERELELRLMLAFFEGYHRGEKENIWRQIFLFLFAMYLGFGVGILL